VRILNTLILVLIIAAPVCAQGVVMVMNETSGGQTTQSRMHLDRTHVRAEVREQGPLQGQQMIATFDSEAQVMRLIDGRNRTYTEVTQRDLQQIGGMMAQLQEQLKNLPPEQRKMMEDMMKGRGGMPNMPGMAGAAPPSPITYKRTGSSKVGQWACTTYDGFRGADKIMEVCAAEGSALGLTAADFRVVQQLADFMKNIAPQQIDQLSLYGTDEKQGYAGFPVRRVMFRNGKPDSTSELVELRREAIPASTFAVPDGFKKQEMGMGRGR
jgi:hypothetical protein